MRSLRVGVLLCLLAATTAFTTPRPLSLHKDTSRFSTLEPQKEEEDGPWNPELRRIMGSLSIMGALETAYLTYSKLAGPASMDMICRTDGDCTSVLTGPYATLPNSDIPLASLGLAAYLLTMVLSVSPVITENANDDNNRIALLSLTTAMGTFSVFLMSLLYGVLHTSCPYCLASASFSITLAACTWLGGCLPTSKARTGLYAGLSSFVATTAAAALFFVSVDPEPSYVLSQPEAPLLASSQKAPVELVEMSPPSITTTSSKRALRLSQDLQSLNARMFGAYWCTHCYDQKQALGKQAFASLTYVECSKDGKNAQVDLCKEANIPGYPTWEIGGKLYPGERPLDELEDIVKELKQ